jgi:hypothetical protein
MKTQTKLKIWKVIDLTVDVISYGFFISLAMVLNYMAGSVGWTLLNESAGEHFGVLLLAIAILFMMIPANCLFFDLIKDEIDRKQRIKRMKEQNSELSRRYLSGR